MSEDQEAQRETARDLAGLIGCSIEQVLLQESGAWWFECGSETRIVVEGIWRILEAGQVRMVSTDHGQRYGLAKAFDAQVAAREVLVERTIREIEVGPANADVTFVLDGAISLQLLVDSSGYEAWQIYMPNGAMLVGRSDQVFVFPGD